MTNNWQASGVEQKISLNFKHDEILRLAMIHPSYAKQIDEPEINNERLEYLGEAILKLVIVDYIVANFTHFTVAKLKALRDKLTEGDRLTQLWYELQLGDTYPFLGLKEERHRLRIKQSNPFEGAFKALVGAIYLDRGFAQVRNWLYKHLIVPLLQRYLKPELAQEPSDQHLEFLGGALLQGVIADYLYCHILHASPNKLKSLSKKLSSKESQAQYLKLFPESVWQDLVPNTELPKTFKTLIARLYLQLNTENAKSSLRKTYESISQYCFDDDAIMQRAIELLLKDGKPQKWIIHKVMGYPSNKYDQGREKFYELVGKSN